MSEQTLGAPAIDKIEKLAKDSQDHTLVAFRPEAEPIDVYLLYDKRSGKHERIIAERDSGRGVLLFSTELDEVVALADRIAVMYRGEFIAIVPATTSREDLGLLMAGVKP